MDPESLVVEQEYDTAAFQLPDGVKLDGDSFKAVAPVLKDLDLSQEQAGKLIGAYSEKVVPLIQQRTLKQCDDLREEMKADIARELHDDTAVGGKFLEESRSFAAKAMTHFIPDKNERAAFSEFLNKSGFGNQRHLMRVFAGAGKLVSQAAAAGGETGSKPTSDVDKFYGRGTVAKRRGQDV